MEPNVKAITVLFHSRTGKRLREVPSASYRGMDVEFGDLISLHGRKEVEIHTVDPDESSLTLGECRALGRF
jgi:hypothetical protein